MKKIVFIAVLFLSTMAFSQDYELGKVTIEELKEKVCPADTSAVAAVLFNVGKTSFSYTESEGFELLTEICTKIKIYKKEGYSFADQAVRFYNASSGSIEKVDISKAVTFNLVNNKIEKTKLNNEGEFEEKINKYWSRKKITMPNVKVGSVIEFRIQIRSPYIDIPDWEFQKNIPVNYSEFTTYIPEYYVYNTRNKGFRTPAVTKVTSEKSFSITSKVRSENATTVVGTKFNTETIKYIETKTKYILENIPALKEEAFVNNINNYRTTVLHELSSKRFPNSPFENYSTDWVAVTKKVYENENFGDELKKTGYFEKEIDALVNGLTSQDEKTNIIFNYVKSRMNWDETNNVYCDEGVKKAYQNKKGNSAEINLMLSAMLSHAGIEANPILISTRSNGISIFPSRTSFNYVICGVELQNQVVLYDATNKYALPNILPISDLNWFGKLIKKDGTSIDIDIMPKSNSKDVVNIMGSINENGEITGKIRHQYFDYNAFVFRQVNNPISKDSYIEKLEKEHNGLEIGEYNVLNSNDLTLPFVENYDFTSTNSVEIIADKMYVSPFLFFTVSENPFKQDKREYPIDFVYPHQDKFNISLTIPEGYTVETLPQPRAVVLTENLAGFKYNISSNNNQVQIVYTFDINQAIIGSEYYEALKSFYKEIVEKQTEKIVLKKG
jgi:hypothetical protein